MIKKRGEEEQREKDEEEGLTIAYSPWEDERIAIGRELQGYPWSIVGSICYKLSKFVRFVSSSTQRKVEGGHKGILAMKTRQRLERSDELVQPSN